MVDPKLKVLVKKIRNKNLREKVTELLKNPTIEIAGKKYQGLPLDTSPAGLSHHHCYPGGFIEHTVSTANIALALCDSVEEVYCGKVNRDFVVAGVLVHDIFKPLTYALNEKRGYTTTRLSDYLDHLSIATAELVRRDFPIEIVHIASAHHGAYGPIRPRTIEALICHLADLADSRLNAEVLNAAAYLMRKTVGGELYGLTSKEAFEIVHSKSTEGSAGVAKTFTRIKQKRKTHKT